MSDQFFERPILNSPYRYPAKHLVLDADGQPTNRILETRRRSELITPVPKPKKRRQPRGQLAMAFDAGDDLSSREQEYNPTPIINEVRTYVETWRNLANPEQWLVTPETARLLKHWRSDAFQGVRPFFCQVEAVETTIWLTEVAPKSGARLGKFWEHLRNANAEANPDLLRLALKLATGAGKTTVMAMIIAWQTVNAARHPGSKTFSRGFLVVSPGITIRDRLRVLQPNDPESYYRQREIVPPDMLGEIDRAKIVITNYHTFKLRERLEVAKGTLDHLNDMRSSTVLFHLTRHLLYTKYRDPDEKPKLHLFGQLKRIARQWLDGGYLKCSGGTSPAQLCYRELADMAAERIKAAITESLAGDRPVKAILDAYNPSGSTRFVNFTTSKATRWQTDPRRCHVNWVVCDSDWEAEFCRVAELHPKVRAYVKNQNLGLEVPYLIGSVSRRYIPDFLVQIDDGRPDPLNLIVEIKGFRNESAKDKANAMRAYWIPGVNNLGKFGRWAFAEFTAIYEIESAFGKLAFALP